MKRKPIEPEIDKRGEFEPRLPKALNVRKTGFLSRLKRHKGGTSKGGKGRRGKASRGKLRVTPTFSQRVVVKARVVKGSGDKSVQRMRSHIAYLNRSGTGLTGERPEFFGRDGNLSRESLSKESLNWKEDPHHFRFIVSPEKAPELDLENYVRRVIQTMEHDLKSRLTWYAACHYNTDNPHAHVVVRGVDEKGEPLILSRDYLSHGIRQAAEQEATLRLGKRDVKELSKGIEKTLTESRFTFIDKELTRAQSESKDNQIKLEPLWGNVREWEKKGRENKLKRLAFLERKGLATEVSSGVWKLKADLEPTLRDLQQREKISAIISPYLLGLEARKQELVIHRESEPLQQTVRGSVLGKGLSDELSEKKFMLISGDDGRTHYFPLGKFSEPQNFPSKEGHIVEVRSPRESFVKAESVINRFAGKADRIFDLTSFREHVRLESESGRWSLPEHLALDEYVELFGTRLDTLEKAGLVKVVSEGRWKIPEDIETKAEELSANNKKVLRLKVSVESYQSLPEQINRDGAAWLDKLFSSKEALSKLRGEFGREVKRALSKREEHLKAQNITPHKELFNELLRKEEQGLKERLQKSFGTETTLKDGEEKSAKVVRYELLGDGYRMVAKSDSGFIVRPVSFREPQFAYQSEVTLTKAVIATGGRKREVIRAKAISKPSAAQSRGRRR